MQLGGEGTPLVAEFAPAVLAARMELSAYAGGRLVADVLDLEHRLPLHWTRVQALEVDEQHARFVARKTRDLSPEEAANVDARIAKSADGRVSWTRFETLVEAAIVAADPDAAAAREQAAAREAFAKTTRSTEHGMRGFYVRADFATIARIDATVAYLAQALLAMGDNTPLDQRRVKAVLIMANPTQAFRILAAYAAWHRDQTARETAESETAEDETVGREVQSTEPEWFDPTETAELLDERNLLPAVWLYVHLAVGPRHAKGAGVGDVARVDDVARVEGSDPVTAEWVHDHLGPAVPVQDHPGPRSLGSGSSRRLGDPRPT